MRVVILLSVASLVAGAAAAQADLPAALDQIAISEATGQRIPGVAAVVVRKDQIVWASGLGVTSVESGSRVTPDTLFHLGSARVFLAAAAYELSAQGRLQLDAPAGDYLFGLSDKQGQLSTVKLLSPPSEPADEAVVAQLIQSIRAQPASGLLNEMVFQPLGMDHTTFAPGLAMTYPLAVGHTVNGAVSRPMEAGPLFSSARDLGRFLIAYLNGGKLEDQQALPAALIAALSGDSGFGLQADASRGVRLVRQTSVAPGFAGAILIAPDFETGVVVLANRDGASAITIAQKLLERSLPVRFPQSVAILH
jgi:CubicO group peptidase (beta-lactamase class C family)